MVTKEIGQTWTSVGNAGVVFQNSSNYKIELINQDTNTAPTEKTKGLTVLPYGTFKVPDSGYTFCRCKVCPIVLREDVFKISGGINEVDSAANP